MAAGPGRDPARERRWRRLIAQQRRTGATIEAFCQARQLASSAFHYWKRELQRRDTDNHPVVDSRRIALKQQSAAPCFLPVVMAEGAAQSQSRVSSAALCPVQAAAPLELVLPEGEVLRVPAGFDPGSLAQVLVVLRGQR